MNIKNIFLDTVWALIALTACSSDDKPVYPEPPLYDMSGFAKGADVSWLTEMERSSIKFYDGNDREKECMALLRELGMNSIRLRVWVDPVDGWCNKSDLLVKAFRANNLGMRLMIDFHYSDTWADPGQQTKPAAWTDMDMDELQEAVGDHTREILNELKAHDITPEWIQVGNETGNGMLWEEGKASVNMENYADLNNAGYDAVKEVFPDAKVIVHLHGGHDNDLYRWLFDGLKNNGGKWDVIGMSLYPAADSWQQTNADCIANIRDMISRYDSEVMICEVGMPWDEAEACHDFLADLITKAKAIEDDRCLGVFYWEPQSYGGWKGYTLGAFDENGRPTVALDAFKL
ncbi:Arabinogalactan endo-beta-1,4-galactanase [Proteiniphilum saccharofermentans]|uniref:Arabinogalactan endo-beta-1,4-galactanase n=1 Tax=Proteiniphilum saccharofermentans TaxID=1642647 RepID=A0A1R3SVM3_9BACT|nr:glycosyl hydrolase 53 family protein [Proteiniphilum saccharofermentans]SCD19010.1 Arabinogalactan endo-beta-1,4-galactanase [Proteiniphilum saccharofermentans]